MGARPLWRRVDWIYWIGVLGVSGGVLAALLLGAGSHGAAHGVVEHFAAGVVELVSLMWWGVALGILFVGLLDTVPQPLVTAALRGRGGRVSGILRATAAGVFFDLCSHGILMVGMKLYERGASIGQTMAFLLASPWNSISLTLVLIALIGIEWTLAFLLLSAVIAIVTGLVVDGLVAAGRLPDNPARLAAEAEGPAPSLAPAFRAWRATWAFSWGGLLRVFGDGLRGSRAVLRWLLFGIVLAAVVRALIPADAFADWFGPTLFGVIATVIVATILEVCSEGSAPLGADLVTRAGAPGNGFTFLMAGVATDYTELMALRDTTGSWRLALALPLISVPQILLIGLLLNQLA